MLQRIGIKLQIPSFKEIPSSTIKRAAWIFLDYVIGVSLEFGI